MRKIKEINCFIKAKADRTRGSDSLLEHGPDSQTNTLLPNLYLTI